MSAEAVPPAPSTACPLCHTTVTATEARCPVCGFDLGVSSRSTLTRPVFWWTAMGLLAIYLVTLAIVVITK